MVIKDKKRVSELQEEFNDHFPFLKLEVFLKSAKSGAVPSKKISRDNSMSIGQCRTIHNNGLITVVPQMTVEELISAFADVFGLGVRILRKSGRAWINTSLTKDWTLSEQNFQGESLSSGRGKEAAE
jgi:hypothetical protein